MLIYCETNRITPHHFEFIHSFYIGAGAVGETVIQWQEKENDRLRAAIVNVGLACKWFADNDAGLRVVGIESDKDGKDKRFNGEHDVLYSLLCPVDDFEARKLRSLHFEYERYLGRIIQLMEIWGIKIVLQMKNENVRYN